jgi:hypothetical protein
VGVRHHCHQEALRAIDRRSGAALSRSLRDEITHLNLRSIETMGECPPVLLSGVQNPWIIRFDLNGEPIWIENALKGQRDERE